MAIATPRSLSSTALFQAQTPLEGIEEEPENPPPTGPPAIPELGDPQQIAGRIASAGVQGQKLGLPLAPFDSRYVEGP
jgi:hypothetical protein